MIQELNVDGHVPANALMGRSKRLLGRVKRLLKTERRHAPVFRMAVIFLLLITLGIAAIAIASAGNEGTKKSLEKFFMSKPEKMQFVADTTRTKKHEKTTMKKDSGNAEDSKKQKEMAEAGRKLEKAQLEMQKAQLELEKAREEFMRAGGQMRHDMADLSEEQVKHLMMDDQMRNFKLKHEREFDDQRRAMELQRRAMEDHMRISHDDMRMSQDVMRGDRMRQQDMKREMEQFYRMRKDSVRLLNHRNPYSEPYPEAPAPPPVAPAAIDVPDKPGIENPVQPEPPDIENLVQPAPVAPSELLNNDQGTENKDNTAPLDSKLKELEKE